jgi:asparagine synthetase A
MSLKLQDGAIANLLELGFELQHTICANGDKNKCVATVYVNYEEYDDKKHYRVSMYLDKWGNEYGIEEFDKEYKFSDEAARKVIKLIKKCKKNVKRKHS